MSDDLIRTEAELAALFLDWNETRNEHEASEWQRIHVGRLIASLRAAWTERDRKAALLREIRKAAWAVEASAESGMRHPAIERLMTVLARADAELGEDT